MTFLQKIWRTTVRPAGADGPQWAASAQNEPHWAILVQIGLPNVESSSESPENPYALNFGDRPWKLSPRNGQFAILLGNWGAVLGKQGEFTTIGNFTKMRGFSEFSFCFPRRTELREIPHFVSWLADQPSPIWFAWAGSNN